MRRLENSFKNAISGVTGEPAAISEVPGFEISVEKKEGVLLRGRPKDQPEAEETDASEGCYYEVSVKVTGENPEYPAEEKPFVSRHTAGINGNKGMGFIGDVSYIPAGAKYTGFRVVEEYDDGSFTIGHRMPPHHGVKVRADFTDAAGEASHMAVGPGWVRKSERETRAWENARHSRVFYM